MEETQKNANAYLATKPIGKLLFQFSVPCVLAMLVSSLYNIVDQIFIGQSVGYLGNAATNVVFPFTVVALALALLIGDGGAALLSLSLGRGDHESSHKCIGNSIVMSLVVSIVLMLVGFLFTDQLLQLFGVTEKSYEYAFEYMRIILIGIPFYVLNCSVNGAIRADGAPRYSMFSTLLGAVLNLILDPIAIFVLGMGVPGAAIATVIGQVASCAMSMWYFRKPRTFQLCKESFRLSKKIAKRICELGISSFITQMAIVVVISVANNVIVMYGAQSIYGAEIPLSAIGIVMKVYGIVIAFSVGISVGGQPITGYNYGAGNFKRVLMTYRAVVLANIGVGIVATLLFQFCPQVIVGLFGNENALYNEYANLCFRIYLATILLCCVQKASSIFLQSIGRPIKSAILSLSREIAFFVPGIILLAHLGGVTGMLWAAPIADVLAFTLTCILILPEVKAMRLRAQQMHNE